MEDLRDGGKLSVPKETGLLVRAMQRAHGSKRKEGRKSSLKILSILRWLFPTKLS